MRMAFVVAALTLAGCVSISVDEQHAGDDAATAILNARVHECPAERTQAEARSGMDGAQAGVEAEDIAFTPLASDPSRAMRLRRITVQPGGVIAWHNHTALQGMGLIVFGTITEFRNSCLDPIVHHAGDVAREDASTAHGWRNEGEAPAVILVAHVVAR